MNDRALWVLTPSAGRTPGLRIDILLSQIIYCQSSYNYMRMKNHHLSTASEDVYLWGNKSGC
ncbi:hypothetical protein CFter6_0323 [Collimonas fungivorans]|uniref:Uncharacterized protein n=1 Tax=Collimonas fungivorans TaxID=158899 RepID=A0A127P5U6_9BURK|nr:hypothetical protein CFter6_0323 [Collimonas fungivorans]